MILTGLCRACGWVKLWEIKVCLKSGSVDGLLHFLHRL